MNLGLSELLVIIVIGLLVLGIPLALGLVGYSLVRRLGRLEARVEKLEAGKDGNPENMPGGKHG